MASRKQFKKEINYILGDLIDAIAIWEITTNNAGNASSQALIGEVIAQYDAYITKINNPEGENKGVFFKNLRKEFFQQVENLVEKINSLN